MKIDAIGLHHVAMPLMSPFRTAFGDNSVIDSLLVSFESEGVVGWGESAPWGAPWYSGEWTAGAFLLGRTELAPVLLHRDIGTGDELQRLLQPIKDNRFAKAAFDLAWWDLHARLAAKSLCAVIGGAVRAVDVGADFGVMPTIDDLLREIDVAIRAGFKRVKLKIRPGWDVDVVRAVRNSFPAGAFHVDANSGYRLDDIAVFRALDRMNLAMIEQPLAHDDLHDHAKLQAQLETPVCLDESITSPARARHAIETRAGRWFNLKLGRVGGMTEALKIRSIAEDAGVPCWVGGMLESAIGQSHSTAFGTLPNILYPSDIFPTDRFYRIDLADAAMELSAPGQVRPFPGHGIGCAPNPGRLERFSVQRFRL